MNDKRRNNLTCTVVKFSVITALFIAAIMTLMILFMLDITGINTAFLLLCAIIALFLLNLFYLIWQLFIRLH